MGTWGTSLSSNDLYADIYFEFFELYNEGFSVDEISEKIIRENTKTFDDFEEGYNGWLALAKAQWECKKLDEKVFKKVKQIIESGSDIEVWRRLGASDSELKKRQIMLNKFLETLQSEKPKAKIRRKKHIIIYEPTYAKGDCLTFKLSDGNFGGIIVLEAFGGTEYACNNLFAATSINQLAEPNIDDFKNSGILVCKEQDFKIDRATGKIVEEWKEKPELSWGYPPKNLAVMKKIGTISVTKKYEFKTYNINNWRSGINASGHIDGYMINRINYLFSTKNTNNLKYLPQKNFTGSLTIFDFIKSILVKPRKNY